MLVNQEEQGCRGFAGRASNVRRDISAYICALAASLGGRAPAVVDLPTPPLPDATATMCFTPSMPEPFGGGGGGGGSGRGAERVAKHLAALLLLPLAGLYSCTW